MTIRSFLYNLLFVGTLFGSSFLLACDLPASHRGTCQTSSYLDTSGIAFVFPYTINTPDLTLELDNDLEEISGLDLTPDQKYLVAIQDEDGLLFYLDRNTGKIVKEFGFWKDGDYEGVEVVDQDIYVVKSSGTLYHVEHPDSKRQVVTKYNQFLNGDNNVEGLALDTANNRLLLACKGEADTDPAKGPARAIYAFDLDTKQLLRDPAYCIRQKDVLDFLGVSPLARKVGKLVEFFDPEENDFSFSPSGIAIHPQTGDLYILSAVGNVLMVLGADGAIRHLAKLDKDIHEQPEGICFDQAGTLYIANEAGNEKPLIQRFSPKK